MPRGKAPFSLQKRPANKKEAEKKRDGKKLHRYGGEYGIRDSGLAESAVAAPQGSFGGTLLHEGPIEQAAAYLFHLCANHAFLDGNKRVALAAALVFLDLHGIEVYDRDDELYELTMGIARSELSKEETTTRLGELCVGDRSR